MESPIPMRPDLRLRSCTECRRRKQKCKPSQDPNGKCANCLKRYPPVACIQSQLDGRMKSNRKALNVQYQVQVIINNQPPLETPRQFGGTIADINTANIVPIDPNPQNAQLFYYYLQRLAPLIATLDGFNTPPLHYNSVLPLLMHSPLLPKIGILEAAQFQQIFWQQPGLAESRRMIVLKGEIIAQINEFISKDFNKTYQEAIQSVLHLALLEYYWGNPTSVMAHAHGLKDMVALRGGVHALHNPLVTQLIILFDFEIACGYEQALCILQSEDLSSIIALNCPETCETPLYESGTPFSTLLERFSLPYALTTALDDVRLLTSSITSLATIKRDPDSPFSQNEDTINIISQASRIYQATAAIPSIPLDLPLTPFTPRADLIHEVLRTTVLIYTSAISSRLPISTVCMPLRQQVYGAALEFNLTNWKSIPGLLLWVLFVCSPGSGQNALERLLRTHKTLAAMYVGLKDFGFTVQCLRNFLAVQMWIAEGSNVAMPVVGELYDQVV